jgi:Fe-S-cluster-containing dehydrogenase component
MPRRSSGLRRDAKLRSRRWRKIPTDVELARKFREAVLARDALCIGLLYSAKPCEFETIEYDPMHVIPAQLLRRRGFAEEIVYDPRNGVAGCRLHHRRNDDGKERIPAEFIPARAREFARDHGLEGALEKLYG